MASSVFLRKRKQRAKGWLRVFCWCSSSMEWGARKPAPQGYPGSPGIRIILWNKHRCIGSSVSMVIVVVDGRWESTRVTRPETWHPLLHSLPWICRPFNSDRDLQTPVIQHSYWCYKDFISRRGRFSLYHEKYHSQPRTQQDSARDH